MATISNFLIFKRIIAIFMGVIVLQASALKPRAFQDAGMAFAGGLHGRRTFPEHVPSPIFLLDAKQGEGLIQSSLQVVAFPGIGIFYFFEQGPK